MSLKLAAPASRLCVTELYLHQQLLTDQDSVSGRYPPPAVIQPYVGCAATPPLPQWPSHGGTCLHHCPPLHLSGNSNSLFHTCLLLQILKPKFLFFTRQFPAVFLSQCYRLRKLWSSAGTSGVTCPTPLFIGGSATAGCSGPCPVSFPVSLRMEILPPPWAACSNA